MAGGRDVEKGMPPRDPPSPRSPLLGTSSNTIWKIPKEKACSLSLMQSISRKNPRKTRDKTLFLIY